MRPQQYAMVSGSDVDDEAAARMLSTDFLKHALRLHFSLPSYRDAGERFAGIDAGKLYHAARLNKLVLFLGPQARDCLTPVARDELRASVQTYRSRTLAMNARVLSDTIWVARALEALGVPFSIMKGVGQQKVLYGHYFAKPVGDVDVLVPRRHYANARALLIENGFALAGDCHSLWWRVFLGEQHFVRARDGEDGENLTIVDLHHKLQQPGSPSPHRAGAFIDRREMVDMAGAVVPIVATAQIPLVVSINIVKAIFNHEAAGGYVCDFYAAVRSLGRDDTDALIALAANHGLVGTVLLAFRASSLVFGVRFPQITEQADRVLAATGDDDLELMLLAPWSQQIAWPHRREVLKDLCGHDVIRFVGEAGWAAASDLCRRALAGGLV